MSTCSLDLCECGIIREYHDDFENEYQKSKCDADADDIYDQYGFRMYLYALWAASAP